MITIIYPERRLVSQTKIITWAMDWLVNHPDDAVDLYGIQPDERPSLENAMEILADQGLITFGKS